jgi:hypothetical protein
MKPTKVSERNQMPAQTINVRFTEQQIDLLERIAAQRGVDRTELPSMALTELARRAAAKDEEGTSAR